MQSLSTALYPATDSEYRIQWGTYGVIVKVLIQLSPDSTTERRKAAVAHEFVLSGKAAQNKFFFMTTPLNSELKFFALAR
ncbi:hypothetical protein JYQ62_33970 [Nostoc sp. UHCC 0702]|nr:hypothetical protein JYQ62_33970 [Nostoc sp. UHCC 0702]